MKNRLIRKFIAIALILTLGIFATLNNTVILAAVNTITGITIITPPTSTTGNPGNPKDEPQVVGQLTVVGAVTVNDRKVINGTSVFTDSRIKVACSKGNGAIVNLGRLGRVELPPGANLMLRFSNGLISGDLIEGNVTVNAPSGVKVSINTTDGVAASDGKEASVLPVRAQRGVRCVPMVVSNSSSSPVINSGLLTAILLGSMTGVVAGVASVGDDVSDPMIGPPPNTNNN